jgi:hypothetical protein
LEIVNPMARKTSFSPMVFAASAAIVLAFLLTVHIDSTAQYSQRRLVDTLIPYLGKSIHVSGRGAQAIPAILREVGIDYVSFETPDNQVQVLPLTSIRMVRMFEPPTIEFN